LDAIVAGRLVKQEGTPYGAEEEAWLEAVDAARGEKSLVGLDRLPREDALGLAAAP
jgi:hypothetical protein